MGIRYLNSFLKKKCPTSIRQIHLEDLAHKHIAIDVSIYLYKFEADGMLLDNMRAFVSMLRQYEIHPTFVFDGKPPAEKMDTLFYRKQQRQVAASECNDITNRLQDIALPDEDKKKLVIEYDRLRRSSVVITRDKVDLVKQMFDEENVSYCTAPSEADTLCATMVIHQNFWGCMSDDMDMFVYGCNNIIRDMNMKTHTAQLYVLPEILKELDITYDNFKRVCVISGTDYNASRALHVPLRLEDKSPHPTTLVTISSYKCKKENMPSSITLYAALKLLNRFRQNVKYSNMTFYDWLKHYIKFDIDYVALDKAYDMFSVPGSIPGSVPGSIYIPKCNIL